MDSFVKSVNSREPAVLLIYTGGTIGMREDKRGALVPFNFEELISSVPEISRIGCRIDHCTFSPLIDSSDVEPSLWIRLATIIKERYDDYDGFVILHGTDTMAYSASALSFMLENLSKPVIFTGSQLPVGRPRTDGKENLISSVEIAAAKDRKGNAIVPEVCIFFNSQLLRGNRSTKADSTSFHAFASPNCPPLATAGIDIRYNNKLIIQPSAEPFRISTDLDTRVSILKLHPGITPQVVRDILLGSDTRAVIIETFGSGNAISREWFIGIIRESNRMGKILLNVTQCLSGYVNMELYVTGMALRDSGVVSGRDMTTEAALSKLFFLMGTTSDNDRVKELLEQNLRGEMS